MRATGVLLILAVFAYTASAHFYLDTIQIFGNNTRTGRGLRGSDSVGADKGDILGPDNDPGNIPGGNTDECGTGIADQPRTKRFEAPGGTVVVLRGKVTNDHGGGVIYVTSLEGANPDFSAQAGVDVYDGQSAQTDEPFALKFPLPDNTGSSNILVTLQMEVVPSVAVSGGVTYYECVDLLLSPGVYEPAPDNNEDANGASSVAAVTVTVVASAAAALAMH